MIRQPPLVFGQRVPELTRSVDIKLNELGKQVRGSPARCMRIHPRNESRPQAVARASAPALLEIIHDADVRMRRLLRTFRPRNVWKRIVFRAVDFSDNYAAFRTAYLVTDPYNLKSAQAAYRFLTTNRIIQEKFGQVHRLLEIGCAEGYQSQHLKLLCNTLFGIDVSAKAIARAKARCPTCSFSAEDLFSIQGPFDLVVAAEVLYYIRIFRRCWIA